MPEPTPRGHVAKRKREIIELAMRHFATKGYEGAHVGDMAFELGIAKGSIFQHFHSKPTLFLAAYKEAVGRLPRYLDAPDEVRKKGFFATLRYWLERTDHLAREDWLPYRMTLIANYGTDLALRQRINRWLFKEDPYGTAAFVADGLASGELREDVDAELLASFLDWTLERFQDALLSDELDPGLFRRHGRSADRAQQRIEQFLRVLRGALEAPPSSS